MAVINGTNNNDTITPGLISPGVSGFPTALNDFIYGWGGNDSIDGGAGNDVLEGDNGYNDIDGNDTLNGGTGNDTMRGYDGNDTYIVDSAGDDIDGELYNDSLGGVDTVRSSLVNTSLLDFTHGYALENLTLIGNAALNGVGNLNNNVLTGNARNNSLFGDDGNDTILGGGGHDLVDGGRGNDVVRGQAGNDIVAGGAGVDIRIGGTGNDTFTFQFLTQGEIDLIDNGDGAIAFQGVGNAVGDIIDVSGIDARAGQGGNQSFNFVQGGGGGGQGTLWVVNLGNGMSQVRGNTDGDAAFELQINIDDAGINANAYRAADFIL